MKKSPLAEVKERFGDKEKLVAAVKKLATDDLWLERANEDKGLDLVSNKKLLKLHDTLEAVKKDHGSRAKLIDAIADAEGRGKDGDYKAKLAQRPTPRLVDQLASAKKGA